MRHGIAGRVVAFAGLALCACASGSSSNEGALQAPSGTAGVSGGAASSGGWSGGSSPPPGGGGALPTAGQTAIELPDGACVSTGTIEASLRPTHLLFVIDRSGSMACNLPPITSTALCEASAERVDSSAPSKWEIVRDALKHALASLPAGARAAITYFSNDDTCGVQSAPDVALGELDAAQQASLAASLDAVVPHGGTPIVGALILAFKHLNPDQTPGLPAGKRFVVLLTDGSESCAPDQTARLLETEMPKARTAAITTFVIGVPGSEGNRGFLSRLAFAGGTPSSPSCDHRGADPRAGDCHFDMSEQQDLAGSLARALATITGRTLSCEFDVPQPRGGGTLDYDKINVVYVPELGQAEQVIGRDAERPCDGGANGWQYSDDRSKILLCGDACARVRRAASINIALGCRSYRVE